MDEIAKRWRTKRLLWDYKATKWQNWDRNPGLCCFYHSTESFGVLSLKPDSARGPSFVAQWGRGADRGLWQRSSRGEPVPCGMTPRGPSPCTSMVGGSFSAALELLGGTALLPPKVVPEVSDILSFTSSSGKKRRQRKAMCSELHLR